MENSTIHYRLDLSLHLVDTTTGGAVTERNVRFFIADKEQKPLPRGSGTFVFLNTGREDFDLTVKVYGYEETVVKVRYEELDSFLPVKEVFLIPGESLGQGEKLLTFSGCLPGLGMIDAVRAGTFYYSARKYDERKKQVTVFKSIGPDMRETKYGLVNLTEESFEMITVKKVKTSTLVELDEKLKTPFTDNTPIARVVFGQADENGNYLLRVRDDAECLKYLVRYRVGDAEKFKLVDFHTLGEEALT